MNCIDCGRHIVGRLIVVCPDCVQIRRENPSAHRQPTAWYDEGETIIGTFGPGPGR